MEKKVKIGLVILFVGIAVVGGWFILGNQLQISKERFGIYLLENDELVISDKDIIFYNKTSHEVKLTEEGVKKVKALRVPVSGRPFVIKLDGEEIYGGSFWISFSSLAYSGIVIDTLMIENNTIKIEKGYPSSEFFEGVDPRDNSEIFDYFEKVGKLTE